MYRNKKEIAFVIIIILVTIIIVGFYQFFIKNNKGDNQIVDINTSEKNNDCQNIEYSIELAPTTDPYYSNEIREDRKMKQLNNDSLKKLNCVIKNNNGKIPTSELERLTSLEFLDLKELVYQRTIISDFSFLSKLINLIDLRISQTDISDLSPLSGLKNLTNLNIDMNNISDLSPLSGLTKLETLFMCDNPKISDLSPLENLPNLKKLYLNGETRNAKGLLSLKNKEGLTIIDCGQ